MEKAEQIKKIAGLLGRIEVPAGDGYPPIDMAFIGPIERIAEHLYGEGVRVHETTGVV